MKKHARICLLNLVLVAALAVSCQSVKELGSTMAEYNRLITQPEYLEQRWKEVVAEWKKETAEQNLGFSDAKALLHQHLSDNHLLSLSSNHVYGNSKAEHREWIAYVRDHVQVQEQLKKWRETLPRRFSIHEDQMEAYIESFLSYYGNNFVDTSWKLAIDDLRKNYLPIEAGLYESEVFDIAVQYLKRERQAAREKRRAERKAREEREEAERKAAEEKRLAERKAAEEKRLAEKKAAEEKRLAEEKAKKEREEAEQKEIERLANDPEYREQRWKEEVAEWRKLLEEKGIEWLKQPESIVNLDSRRAKLFKEKTNGDYEANKKATEQVFSLAVSDFFQKQFDEWWQEVETKKLDDDTAIRALKNNLLSNNHSNAFSRVVEAMAERRLARRAQERRAQFLAALEPLCAAEVAPLRQPWGKPVPLYKDLVSGTMREQVLEWAKANGVNDLEEKRSLTINIGKKKVALAGIRGKLNSDVITFCFATEPFGKIPKEKSLLVAVIVCFYNDNITAGLLAEKYSASHKRDAAASQEGHVENWINVQHSNSAERIPEVYVNDRTTVIIETSKTYEHLGSRKHLISTSSPELYLIDTSLFEQCFKLKAAMEKGEAEISRREKMQMLDF